MHPILLEALRERQESGRPVRVALIGAGRFGTTVAAQLGQMPALRLSVVCDVREESARGAWEAYGGGGSAGRVFAETVLSARGAPERVATAVDEGRPISTDDVAAAVSAPVDVVVEATGRPEIAARTALGAIRARHHVVMVTVEADVLLGSLLRRYADEAGVVYTLTDGDQPGVIKRLCDWVSALGYEIVAAGRGTRFYPSDAAGVPEEAFQRYGYDDELVTRRRFNAQMYNSFRDGSKAQVEMCALANVTGLVPDRRGMHEPAVGVSTLARRFALQADGGLLSQSGVVELANCVGPDGQDLPDGIASGVFVVLRTANPILAEDLPFYGLPGLSVASGAGGYAAFWRPFHLCGIETPFSIAEAALLGRATAAPRRLPVADVIAVAKRDLRAGDVLDGSGGRNVRGVIERAEVARAGGFLPEGLADRVPLRRDVKAGEPITYAMVDLSEDSLAVQLRRKLENSEATERI
ncbi:MAG TPA: SAF domain-containing protein [Chloroflexota bacterium]|nr:SAF domain-containing protein [Chloroflexota bacterium]